MEILNHPLFTITIILCILGEYFYSRSKGLNVFNGYETFSSFIMMGIDRIVALFTGSDGGAVAMWLWSHRLFEFDFGRPVNLTLAFLASEFVYYWSHWYNHHVNIGWATHIMHHSPTKLNLSVAYRLGITRMFSLGWVIFLPLMIVGFQPRDIAWCLGIIFLMQFFLHTELIPSLGFLEKILNTPSNHQVHHSSDPRYYNKNLGGITMIFDHLFGTYQAPYRDKYMEYGIPEVMNHKNIWHEITCHWVVVLKSFKRAQGMSGKLKALFGSPGQEVPAKSLRKIS